MSKDSYAQYLIREKERKRLEKERLQRLEEERRRQEKIRKKMVQLRRQEEIRREKERLAVIDSLRALGASLQQKKPVVSEPIPPTSGSRDIANRMREMMGAIDVQLQALQNDFSLVFASQLEEITQRVAEIKQDNYDPFYYQSLQWLQRDLRRLVVTAPRVMEELYEEAELAKREIDELLVQLQLVNTRSILESQRQRSADLISNLESLLRENNPKKIISCLPQIHKDIQGLWRDFTAVEERDQVRSYVLQNVREVLEAMGYQALDGVDSGEDTPQQGPAPLSLLFRAPESGAVELTCGLDNSLHAEFVNIKGADDTPIERQGATMDQRYRCEKWCQDYDRLQNELAQRDILLQEHWRIAPTEEGYREVIVPEEFIEEDRDVVPPPATSEGREQS
ncbi:MAG: hypothetical protein GX376_05585 [Firmicutes bacterium]|nr:hypothetical protein [Bacillota bacterium]